MDTKNNVTDFLTDIADAIRGVGSRVSYTPDSEGRIRNLSVTPGEVLTITLDSSLSSFEYLEEIHLEITINGNTSYPGMDFSSSLIQTYTVPSGVTSMTVRVYDDGGTLDTVPYTLTINRTTDELINPQDFSTRIRSMGGGSSGGGSTPENCTVTLDLVEHMGDCFYVRYVSYDENGGLLDKHYETEEYSDERTISVAKNTLLTIFYAGYMAGSFDGDAIEGYEFKKYLSGYARDFVSLYHFLIEGDVTIYMNPDW